jgi:hypothetical protein
MKTSENQSDKHKRGILIMGSFLAIAILLNIYQYLNTAHSVLNSSHDIKKQVVRDGIKWTEMRTKIDGYPEAGQYELWLTSQGAQPKLVETFDLDIFSDLTWQMNDKNGIDASYWSGGPEGGTSETIIYNHAGDEQARSSQELPNGREFTFEKPMGPRYTVSYITDGACTGNTYESANVPEVRIQGIAITSGLSKITTREFLLLEASTVDCDVIDGGFYNPSLKINSVNDEKIDFELADGKTAIINYGLVKTPEVKFN